MTTCDPTPKFNNIDLAMTSTQLLALIGIPLDTACIPVDLPCRFLSKSVIWSFLRNVFLFGRQALGGRLPGYLPSRVGFQATILNVRLHPHLEALLDFRLQVEDFWFRLISAI